MHTQAAFYHQTKSRILYVANLSVKLSLCCCVFSDIEAECRDDFMKLRVAFNDSFSGLIYSAGLVWSPLTQQVGFGLSKAYYSLIYSAGLVWSSLTQRVGLGLFAYRCIMV
jgi:hypothetical protein